MKTLSKAWIALALLLVALPARCETDDTWDRYFTGQEDGTTAQDAAVAPASSSISWGRWAAINLTLLAGLAGVYVYTRRKKRGLPAWLRRPSKKAQAAPDLNVASSVSLGNGQTVHLVRGAGFRVLVGSWSGGMTSLGTVPDASPAPAPALPVVIEEPPAETVVEATVEAIPFPVLMEKSVEPDESHEELTEQVLSRVRKLRAGMGVVLLALVAVWVLPQVALAAPAPMAELAGNFGNAEGSEWIESALFALGILTVLALAPALLITLTSFTRLIIVFAFLRQALGTQNTPPNQVLIGLSLFLTFFIMAPTFDQMKREALDPYMAEEISFEVALDRGVIPLREFMFRQTRIADLELMVEYHAGPRPASRVDVPLTALVPAFMISELKTAFEIGFLLYVPFLIVDLIVSTVLLAMGMMVLPPIIISLPFKILLFLLVDGWNLLVKSLLMGFG
jgi:flagellar biosynthesis protein FliP